MESHIPLSFIPGINPVPDETKKNTRQVIDGNHIRFHRNDVEKIGGHVKEAINLVDLRGNILSATAPAGCCRTLFSFERSNKKWAISGTSTKLYAKLGSSVTNITPLKTSSTATLGTDPLALVNGDATMTVTYAAHGLAVGARIKFLGATHGTGGFANSYINVEHIIATVPGVNSFTVELAVNVPATDSTEGGAAVAIYTEIATGGCDAVSSSGPGIGTPGLGVPGGVQTDTSLVIQPRIWWMDAFGDNWVGGPGQQGKCYQWLGDVATAPTIIANAPNADWGWVEDAKLVILSNNTLANSATGDYTSWTPGASSSAYSDDKEDATKLITRLYINGINIVFAEENKAFTLQWVGGATKWVWKEIDCPIGICGPHGARGLGGVGYVFGRDNFYLFNGGLFSPLPNNSLLKYVFQDINLAQRYKFFVWFNHLFDELHFHYASANSNENDRVAIFSLSEGWWSKRESLARSAADTSGLIFDYPILATYNNGTYQHEVGYNDDTSAMNAFVKLAQEAIANGAVNSDISGMEIDAILTGDLTIELYGETREESDESLLESFTVDSDTKEINCMHETQWRSWLFRSNEVDGYFRLGRISEYIQPGSEF